MEMPEIKGKYPSEQNTKSIACRIPIADWVKFFNDAQSLGVNMNDYLILKLYSKNTLGEVNNSEEYLEISKEEIYKFFTDEMEDNGETFKEINIIFDKLNKHNHTVPLHGLIDLDGYLGFSLNNGNIRVDKDHYLILRLLLYYRLGDLYEAQQKLKLYRKNSAPNLVKIRTELSQLIAEKFGQGKDAKEIKKEIFDLLSELE